MNFPFVYTIYFDVYEHHKKGVYDYDLDRNK